jgi:hypothetical protein
MELEEQSQNEPQIIAQTGEVVEPGEAAEVEAGESATPDEEIETPSTGEDEVTGDELAADTTPKGGVQKKLDKLTARWKEAERQKEDAQRKAAYWEGRAEGREPDRETVAPRQESVTTPTDRSKPKYEDFDNDADFVEALSDWKTDQKIAQVEARRIQEAAEDRFKVWKKEGKGKYQDFEEVALRQPKDGGPRISTAMVEAINDSPRSHDLAYFLGKNPGVADRIANLPPLAAAREIGRLEAGLESSTGTKPRIQSNAPAPIKPITGEGSAAVADITKMSTAEYIAYQNQREFGRK